MFAAAEPDFEADVVGGRIEQVGKIGRTPASDVERKPRQQMFDQIGLVDAEFVALAPPEKRTVRVSGAAIARRCIAIAGIAGRSTHRSV
jgi:hypothetical protein